MIEFFIPIPPITKKNSQQIMVNRSTGKPFVMPSKAFKEYESAAVHYIPKRIDPISAPVNVECHFYMPTRRKCDLTNLLEAIDDLMVHAGLLEDDNYTIIESHDGSRVHYNKMQPGTVVRITEVKHGNETEQSALFL